MNKQLEDIILLSIILDDNEKILKVSKNDFNYQQTQWLYTRINDLYKSRQEITITSVADGNIKVLAYLSNIKNDNFTSFELSKQIEELRKLNKQRDINKLVRFMNENKDNPNVIDNLKSLMQDIEQEKSSKLVDLADVVIDTSKKEKYKSYVKGLDSAINGFRMGELTVWTGKSGHGKSTFISQLLVEAIEQGFNVCSYSGELKLETFRNWIELQMAGDDNITLLSEQGYDRKTATISSEVLNKIRKWYSGKIYCYDNRLVYDNVESNFVTNIIIEAILKYNCKVFLIDNLMTCSFENTTETDYYKAQSDFVGKLSYIAKAYNVHIHLVAHPRKTQGEVSQDDISGTSDTFKRADNVVCVSRTEKNTNNLKIMKCRETGINDATVECNFLVKSKRLCDITSDFAKYRKYSWDKESEKICPF